MSSPSKQLREEDMSSSSEEEISEELRNLREFQAETLAKQALARQKDNDKHKRY